jgi:hypothetical protein
VAVFLTSDKLHQNIAQSLARAWAYEAVGSTPPIRIIDGNLWGFVYEIPYSKYVNGEETRRGVVRGTYTGGKNPNLTGTTIEDYNSYGDTGSRAIMSDQGRVKILVQE